MQTKAFPVRQRCATDAVPAFFIGSRRHLWDGSGPGLIVKAFRQRWKRCRDRSVGIRSMPCGAERSTLTGCCLPSRATAWLSWSGRRDLNPRPSRWQRDALPLSYTRVQRAVLCSKDGSGWQARAPRVAATTDAAAHGGCLRPISQELRAAVAACPRPGFPPLPATRQDLFARLAELGIATSTLDHEAVFTVAESSRLERELPGGHTKNLFLKDKKDRSVPCRGAGPCTYRPQDFAQDSWAPTA